jgi:hypothetical protein
MTRPIEVAMRLVDDPMIEYFFGNSGSMGATNGSCGQ